MSFSNFSRRRFIGDLQFTDQRVWIHGTIKKLFNDHLIISDDTGEIKVNLDNNELGNGQEPVIPGELKAGSHVRIIGEVMPNIDRTFTIRPIIIQDLDKMGVDEELYTRLRKLEDKFEGDDTT